MSGEEYYICPVCLIISQYKDGCHGPMVPFEPGEPGNEMRKPIKNQHGQYHSRAPRWFHEAYPKLDIEVFKEHRKAKKDNQT